MTVDSDVAEPSGPQPAPAVDRVRAGDDAEIHFWFPVTVEIIGAGDPGLEDRIVARVYDELNDELASRP